MHAPLPNAEALKQLPPDGRPEFNRLVFSQSPYLLQHARNPVDWYPWDDEAFAKARHDNKPIFLSIGYSTCHWCHVMEHESFESPAIAGILNRFYIAIKIDREERPDVDAVYMAYVQAVTGGGGWPMSVWLTPDLKPFYGGTYYPPDDRWGRPGFASILTQVARAWADNQANILATSGNAFTRLQQLTTPEAPAALPLRPELLDATFAQLQASYEPRYGGFGDAPKFPRPAAPNFLLRYHSRTLGAQMGGRASACPELVEWAEPSAPGDAATPSPPSPSGGRASACPELVEWAEPSAPIEALDMTRVTLRKMAEGGMYDQLGGGFHRYAVDTRWHVPHFEKMLYDQGQLVCTYLDAFQLTRDPLFAQVVRGTLAYVQRDMTGPDGEWFSAEDADSPLPADPSRQAEGAFYVWEQSEIAAALDPASAAIFDFHYGVRAHGNVEHDPHGEFPNKNVLMVFRHLGETAMKFGKPPGEIETILAAAREKLFALRELRPRPHRDDKTLTAWNGLMLSGFARAAQVLGDAAYRAAATRAAAFMRTRLVDPATGRLLRRCRAGAAGIDAYAEDYAFLIQGLLDLYEATFDSAHLQWALHLQEQLDARFWDATNGAYFRTSGEDASVLLRIKEDYDGAEPAASSVAALNLLRLSEMTGRTELRTRAERTITAFSARLHEMPYAMPQLMVALDRLLDTPRQIVIAGNPDAADTRALLHEVHARFIPNKVLLLADGAAGQAFLATHNEFMAALRPQDNRATAYVCENFACQLPVTEPKDLARLLDSH